MCLIACIVNVIIFTYLYSTQCAVQSSTPLEAAESTVASVRNSEAVRDSIFTRTEPQTDDFGRTK